MRSKNTIDDKLQNFEVDNQEACINKEMQQSGDNSLEHLPLTKGHQHHILQPLIFMVIDFIFFPELDV